MKKLKITSLVIVAALMSVAAGVLWNNYPLESSPLGSETLLVGNSTTNHRWLISDMYILTRSNANRGMQAGSDNLTNWSALATSSKQDASANLDLWSATTPSAYQLALGYTAATTNFATLSVPGLILPDGVTLTIDPTTHKLSSVSGGSGTLTGPGSITSGHVATWSSVTILADSGHDLSEYALAGITNSWPWQALNQPLTANGTAWSLLATSAKQDALGFTPLTPVQSFQQASNLVLTLTVPLDSLQTNGQVSLFGIDSNTNPVPVHLRNNLSFSANGVGGYDLDATGGGTAVALPFTNIWPASSNLVLIDLALSKDWEIGVVTNNPYRFTNIYSLTNLPRTALINFHGSTNGTFAPTIIDIAGGGIMKSNSSAWFPTNASAEATFEVALDWTKTNLIGQWRTNFSPTTASTNSSTGPSGGGGGGGGIALLTHNKGTTSAVMDDTGATLLIAYVAYNTGAGSLSSSRGNTFTAISPEWGGGSAGSSTMYVCINPSSPGTGDTISTTSAGAPSICVASFSGTFTAVDQQQGNQFSGTPTSCQVGPITTTTATELWIAGLNWYNASPSGSVTVDSSYTITDQNTPGSVFASVLSYKIVSATGTTSPTFTTPQAGGSSGGVISIK